MSQHAQPGWYHDGVMLRWWDGSAWGPAAPVMQFGSQSEEQAGKSLAVASHLGGVIGLGFLLPLIVYFTEKDKNRFSRFHAVEALNFQLSLVVASFAGVFLIFASFIAFAAIGEIAIGLTVLIFVLVLAVSVFGLIASIVGALKASQCEWWRYPVSIRFIKHPADALHR